MATREQEQQERIRERFFEWLQHRPTEESALHLQAIEYQDKYFKDLTFEEMRIRRKLAFHKIEEDGQWLEVETDLQVNPRIDRWIFRYRSFRNGKLAECDPMKRTIAIKKGLEGDDLKSVLVHEMIHAFESMMTMAYRDWLLVDLYSRMTKKLGERTTRRCVDLSTHAVVHEAHHGPFFLLKSLELDERLGWKRGSVFGYRREELL